ncbi:LPD11 domain-containing protein [Hydrogenophaga defluvii]|uniref:LPD11 domain-containing protein n=1 Tax=Hydrogenophaga defluvii TaxID=249410 RepID=A0ABW2SEY0_9BURK
MIPQLNPMQLNTSSAEATPVTSKPLAAAGFLSYRYRQPHGFVMIGAKDDDDALKQAGRSIEGAPQLTDLERWNGTTYSPVVADMSVHGQLDKSPDAFNYQLLARLQQDCEYYLGYGNRSAKHLWSTNETEQIAKMKALYDGFSEKPEWISLEDIAQYEAQMCPQKPGVAGTQTCLA